MTTTMVAPARSLEQRMDALARANEIRSARAREKQRIRREGLGRALAVLADPPARFETMKVWDLLIVIPGLGRVKVNRMLTVARISPSKTLGGMTERQRAELERCLRR